MKDILEAGASMLLCALGSLVATFITAGIAARIAANFSARLRARLFNTVQSFSMEEINNFSTASLVTRSTNDVNQVQMFIVMGLQLLITVTPCVSKACSTRCLTASRFPCCCCCIASVVSDSVRPHRRQPTRPRSHWGSLGKNTGVGCHFLLQCMKVKSESEVAQSCPTLSDPMDCSLPGSSIHGIFLARELEWGAIAFSHIYSQACLNH